MCENGPINSISSRRSTSCYRSTRSASLSPQSAGTRTLTSLRAHLDSFHWYLAIIVNPGWVLTEEAANRAAIALAASQSQSPRKKPPRTRKSEALASGYQTADVLGAISTANYYSTGSAAASTSAVKPGKVGTSSSEDSSSSGDEAEEKAAKPEASVGDDSLRIQWAPEEKAELYQSVHSDLMMTMATAGLASATNSMNLDEKQSEPEPELPTVDKMEEDLRESDAIGSTAIAAVPTAGGAVGSTSDTTLETLPDSQPKEDSPMELAPQQADTGAAAGTATTAVAEEAAEVVSVKDDK